MLPEEHSIRLDGHVYPFEKDQAGIWPVERQQGDVD